MAVQGKIVLTISSVLYANKSFYDYCDPNLYYYCKVACGHGVLSLSSQGLALWCLLLVRLTVLVAAIYLLI